MVAQIDLPYLRMSRAKVLSRLFIYTFVEGRPLTTRGRWINPLVFAEFTIFKHLPQLKSVDSPIYLLGTGRNGSTLLGKVLSLHSSVCFLNEPKALWHSVYPYADVLGNYSDAPARFELQANDASDNVQKKTCRLYAFALRVTASDRILDKNAESVFRTSFIRAIFPDARFLFLMRNGHDVVNSVAQWSRSHGRTGESGEINNWWGKNQRKWNILVDELVSKDEDLHPFIDNIKRFQSQHDRAAVEWILTAKKGRKLLQEDRENTHLVRYEDFLEQPNATLDGIFRFCSLPADKKVYFYAQKTIRKSHNRERVSLSPIIEPTFNRVLYEYGYD